jgi:hypothetical protein
MLKNEQLKCKVKDCYRHRYTFSNYCRTHATYRNQYGSPLHKKITKNDYKHHVARCKKLILFNLDNHKGIQEALTGIDTLLANSHLLPQDHLKLYVKDLAVHAIPATDILSELSGFYFYTKVNKRVIVDDIHLKYQLANRVLRLVPFKGLAVGAALRVFGDIIIAKFLLVLIKIARTLEEEDRAEEIRLNNIHAPLKIPKGFHDEEEENGDDEDDTTKT